MRRSLGRCPVAFPVWRSFVIPSAVPHLHLRRKKIALLRIALPAGEHKIAQPIIASARKRNNVIQREPLEAERTLAVVALLTITIRDLAALPIFFTRPHDGSV
jgi:hypothetical protein